MKEIFVDFSGFVSKIVEIKCKDDSRKIFGKVLGVTFDSTKNVVTLVVVETKGSNQGQIMVRNIKLGEMGLFVHLEPS
ncbi:MAG: hypothetical protein AB1333_00695 [Patescibacteria group bacterium]